MMLLLLMPCAPHCDAGAHAAAALALRILRSSKLCQLVA